MTGMFRLSQVSGLRGSPRSASARLFPNRTTTSPLWGFPNQRGEPFPHTLPTLPQCFGTMKQKLKLFEDVMYPDLMRGFMVIERVGEHIQTDHGETKAVCFQLRLFLLLFMDNSMVFQDFTIPSVPVDS